jgi:predicted permease
MTFEVHLGGQRYSEAATRIDFHRVYQDRLRVRNGVRAAGAVSKLPVSDVYNTWTFTYMSETGEVLEHGGYADIRIVEGEYFVAMGIRAVHGRLFDRSDDNGSDLVAIINQSTARRLYEGRDPLGEPIILGRRSFRIVGVVVNVAHDHRGSVAPKLYLPHTQFGDDRNWALSQVAATDLPRRDFAAVAREELTAIDPSLVVHNVRSLREIKAGAMAREQFVFLLFGIFAAVALLLAAVGLYGVMAYNVGRRSREFGIRQAMGADSWVIRRSVFRHAAVTLGVGIAVGLAGSFALSRLLGALLFEVSATDPMTFVVVTLVLMLAGFAASYIPARRATRVDPVEVLRYE